MSNQEKLETYYHRINHFLEERLPSENSKPEPLHQAMRYSVLNGGKRIRALLTYLTGELLDADKDALDIAAAAIELIHAFSLIHDDLPALDNDDLRRGKPSCHKAFGEYTAILAGDALQSMAFELLARLRKHHSVHEKSCLQMIEILSHAIGSKGMAGGEYLDLALKDLTEKEDTKILETIYKLKTSQLIFASVMFGLLVANCEDKNILLNMTHFAIYLGIAFQIHDDVIEIESDTATLGKSNTSDQDNHKPTYISLAGLEFAKKQEQLFYQRAIEHLKKTDLKVDDLINISQMVISRKF